jgi:homogentisate 1,2-dioxygenase
MTNHGFGNYFSSEAIEGTLPQNQNSPLHPPKHLYAEQINGTAFTRLRHQNLHTWMYRLAPSVRNHHRPFELRVHQWQKPLVHSLAPNPMRWSAIKDKEKQQSFLDYTFHIASSGREKSVYLYNMNQSMTHECFINYDAEFLFIPYEGEIEVHTELGILKMSPGHILVIPRGIGFSLKLLTPSAKGYLAENAGIPLHLPELGPIGANSLAHPRHFEYPEAYFEHHIVPHKLLVKSQGQIWEKTIKRSIFDVIAWHGNYAPYRYDLSLFNTINTVSYDHPDPSIFSVLSSESPFLGTASLDFVIFPERWMVAEHTFRIPYFHRNVMSEFMGNIHGQYDAKDAKFEVGGVSIHNQMTPHGPDVKSWNQETTRDSEKPYKLSNTLSFMLESNEIWVPTEAYFKHQSFQNNYGDCWQGFAITETGSQQ